MVWRLADGSGSMHGLLLGLCVRLDLDGPAQHDHREVIIGSRVADKPVDGGQDGLSRRGGWASAETGQQLAKRESAGGRGGSDDMRFHFETIAMHPFRVADAILSVNGKSALDDVNDLAIMRDRHCACLLESMIHIELLDDIAIYRRRAATIYR